MDSKSHEHYIEWDLSCSYDEAIKILSSVLKDHLISWGKVNGVVDENQFRIWTSTTGMRGLSITSGKGIIIDKGNTSQLSAKLSMSWPVYYFKFSPKALIIIVLIAVSLWLLNILGLFAGNIEAISDIAFPLGCNIYSDITIELCQVSS